jgi:hypothetical protein
MLILVAQRAPEGSASNRPSSFTWDGVARREGSFRVPSPVLSRVNEVVAPIGAGGTGEVYKARDTRLDRIVAREAASTETV